MNNNSGNEAYENEDDILDFGIDDHSENINNTVNVFNNTQGQFIQQTGFDEQLYSNGNNTYGDNSSQQTGSIYDAYSNEMYTQQDSNVDNRYSLGRQQQARYTGKIKDKKQVTLNNRSNRKKIRTHKKKSKFWKFINLLLFIIIMYILYTVGEKKITSDFEKVAIYPFVFSNGENIGYITEDFEVYNKYVESNGNEYNTTWESSNNTILIDDSGYAMVTRPSSSKVIILTETYKKFVWTVEREYSCIVIGTAKQDYSGSNIVTADSIINDTYDKEMELAVKENGTIDYLAGDFGDIKVYNEEDALALAYLYKSEFRLPDYIKLQYRDCISSSGLINYNIVLYDGNTELSDETITIIVDTTDFSVFKILNNTKEHAKSISDIVNSIDYESYQPILESYFESSSVAYSNNTISQENGKVFIELYVVVDGTDYYSVKIDTETSEVVSSASLIDTIDIPIHYPVYGDTEKGETVSALGSLDDIHIVLHDKVRNIEIVRETDSFGELMTGFFEHGASQSGTDITDLVLNTGVFTTITSATGEFKDPSQNTDVGIETLKLMTDVYNFYAENFDYISFDGKGHNILVKINYSNTINRTNAKGEKVKVKLYDNAAFVRSLNFFVVNKKKDFMYTVASEPEVLGHEYTHGVISTFASWGNDNTLEQQGINEALSDIMGILVTNQDNWYIFDSVDTDGNALIVRDLENINSETSMLEYPEYYDIEGFTNLDGHSQCVILGHIAAMMDKSGLFNRQELTNIWFKVIQLGFTSDSTFYTVRSNMMQALNYYEYDAEHRDFVAKQFDDRHIYDSSYVYSTSYGNNTEVGEGADNIFTIVGDYVEGDPLLDDSINNKYLVFYSPSDVYFNGGKIYIYENTINNYKLTDEEIGNLIEVKLNESSNIKNNLISAGKTVDTVNDIIGLITQGQETGLDEVLNGNTEITVEYKRVPEIVIKSAEKFLAGSSINIKEFALKTLEVDSEALDNETSQVFNFLMKIVMQYYVVESTAYDLYSNM